MALGSDQVAWFKVKALFVDADDSGYGSTRLYRRKERENSEEKPQRREEKPRERKKREEQRTRGEGKEREKREER